MGHEAKSPRTKVGIIVELEDNNWKYFFVRSVYLTDFNYKITVFQVFVYI